MTWWKEICGGRDGTDGMGWDCIEGLMMSVHCYPFGVLGGGPRVAGRRSFFSNKYESSLKVPPFLVVLGFDLM